MSHIVVKIALKVQCFKIELNKGEQLKFLKEQRMVVNQNNKLQKLLWILDQVTETYLINMALKRVLLHTTIHRPFQCYPGEMGSVERKWSGPLTEKHPFTEEYPTRRFHLRKVKLDLNT